MIVQILGAVIAGFLRSTTSVKGDLPTALYAAANMRSCELLKTDSPGLIKQTHKLLIIKNLVQDSKHGSKLTSICVLGLVSTSYEQKICPIFLELDHLELSCNFLFNGQYSSLSSLICSWCNT